MSKFLGLAVAATATLLAAQASAATVSQTFFTGTSANFATGPAANQTFPFTDNINVAQFDASLGTLNSVTITVTGAVNVAARVSNNGTSGQTESFTDATASVPVQISIQPVNVVVTNATFTSGTSGTGSVAVGQTVTAIASTTPVSTTNTVALAPFLGNSTVVLRARGGALAAAGEGVDNVTFFGGTASANLTLTVTYDFTAAVVPPPAVPEPASLALLGLGLAAIGVIRRRA